MGRPRRVVLALCLDVGAWLFAVPLVVAYRQDFAMTAADFLTALLVGLALGLTQVTLSLLLRIYAGRHRNATLDQAVTIGASALVTGLVWSALLALISIPGFPRSAGVMAAVVAIIAMVVGRSIPRLIRERSTRRAQGERVLVYGAGEMGTVLVRQMLADPSSDLCPVAFLDDDLTKRHLRFSSLRVAGTGADLETVIDAMDIDVVVVARANVTRKEAEELHSRVSRVGATLRLMPTLVELLNTGISVKRLSDIRVEDLLGRQPFSTDEGQIAQLLCDRRVLITGAGGSIGSELSRQVHAYGPAALGLLDRDESALHGTQLSIDGQGLLTNPYLLLADIRDRQRIHELVAAFRPDVVFHAAALKHLPLLETHPSEAWKTNVEGTHNVLEAAVAAGCQVLVNVSTDKAADPTSVLGRSKWLTERVTAHIAATGQRFMSVRFGNVLGSRGSVLDTFRAQIARGGPVTVTDPEVTRFFMTIPEAVHLILQAAALGNPGDTLVLDMGEPIRIVEVAQKLIAEAAVPVDIQFTGLRPGEKLHEQLIAAGEESTAGEHPKITHIRVKPLSMREAWTAWNE